MSSQFAPGKRRRSADYRVRSIVLSGAVVAAAAAAARGQVATVDKGHQVLLDNGLQVWGLDTDNRYPLDYSVVQGANLTAVVFGNTPTITSALSPGNKWGKWTDYRYDGSAVTPQTALTPDEMAHKADLITIGVGDEQQYDIENGTQTRDWFLAAGNGTATTADDVFPNTLLYVNSFFIGDDAKYANFIATANPDAISFDSYPFGDANGAPITPTNWLALAQHFRRHALGSYIGATGNAARPYGLYVQTYHAESEHVVDPGDVQMRWQQFAAWTMGFTFVDAFIFQGGNNHFYDQSTPLYGQFAETARQGRNLGPALTRLISYSNGLAGGGTSIVPGKNADGSGRGVPGDWKGYGQNDAPAGQRFMTSLSAVNLGSKNGGQPGDVYVGFFNPLLGALANPDHEAYFMVMNGLGGDLTLPGGGSDNQALVTETQQSITMKFDFVGTRITSLQRLRRSDGQLEGVPLTATGGAFRNLYQTTITLDGGTGDLFKFNDGTPFVGVEKVWQWDPDGSAAGNDAMTGAGTGGAGAWDGGGAKWSDGATNVAASDGKHVVFWGPAGGAVTIAGTGQSAYSMAFKTNGYALNGGPLTMTGPAVTVDSGVNATIGSVVSGSAGLNKLGPGTLVLTGANTYSGGTYVGGGVLRVDSDAALGASPAAATGSPLTPVDNVWINNGTLQFGASFTLNANRGIQIGAGGGTIDVAAGAEVTYTSNRGFRGYDLVKTGPGTFFAAGPGGGTNNIWIGTLTIREGTWKIVASDGLPVNPGSSDVLRPTQVTLDGGTWQFANTSNLSVTNAKRGITVAPGGGTIDTAGANVAWAGPISGSTPSAVLNKTGSAMLTLNSGTYSSNYPGILNVNGGTLTLAGGGAMGDSATVRLADTAGVSLALSASETIGSLGGGGAAGGNVSLGAQTLTAGGNGNSTTFAGVISGGGGGLTKAGAGTMVLAGANTYTGATTVNGGTLVLRAAAFAPVTANAGGAVVNAGRLVLDYGAGALPSTIVADLKDSHDSSNFTDPSKRYRTTNAADAAHGLGYVDDAAAKLFTIGYTWYGDANLNGRIDADDYALLDRAAAKGLSGWANGDFDYSGSVTSADYMLIDTSLGMAGGLSPALLAQREAQFGPAYVQALTAAVPEPAGLGLIAAAAMSVAGRRRRQRSR